MAVPLKLKLSQAFGMCLLAVAVLFVGYEIVEKIWLVDADAQLLHTLHLIRGISAAVIAAFVTTYVIQCQIDACAPGAPQLVAGGTWSRRIQQVTLRTKLVVPMVMLAVVPALAIGTFTIIRMRSSLRDEVMSRILLDAESKARTFRDFMDGVREDLRVLSTSEAIDSALDLGTSLPTEAGTVLLGEDGEYLGYSSGSTGRDRADVPASLSLDYPPELVAEILAAERPRIFETRTSLVAVAPISDGEDPFPQGLRLMVTSPRGVIFSPIRHSTVFLSVVVVMVVAVSAMTGVLISHYISRPVGIMRRATHALAAGNLSEHVEITTGDEIEGLANDFNTMADRLREAHEHLAGWNVELQHAVERQTDKLHELQSGLARADKLASIGQMTASIMHEIGNPLAAIKTKIQVAQESLDLSDRYHTLLAEVLREVDRLGVVLRSFSRLSRLRVPVSQEIALHDVVRGVMILVGPQLKQKNVAFDASDVGERCFIRGDPDQLRQLLINLILNAADAIEDGGNIVLRTQRSQDNQGFVRVEIVDDGAGMDTDVVERIWDPFFSTKDEGTGLGMAICRKIVDDHSGRIEVRSSPGVGTTVLVEFPETTPRSDGVTTVG